MRMDIRWPVGLFFSTLGAILVAFGLASDSVIYSKSLDINVNLYWGAILLAFGALMAFFGRPRTGPAASRQSGSQDPTT